MRALKKRLRADARTALQIIAALPASRAVEVLVALLETTLVPFLWLYPGRAENQLRAEFTNFLYKIDEREKMTDSFLFERLIKVTQNLLRDGLALPRREIPGGFLLQEGENLEALLSSLALKGEECPDMGNISGHKPRRRGVRHRAAKRALYLALRDQHGKRNCPDKLKQRELFWLAA